VASGASGEAGWKAGLEAATIRPVGVTGASIGEQNIFDGYAVDAPGLIPRFEAIASADVLAPVIDLLPARPCHILDIGAGTGRDAAWLAGRGHRITAVEPVDALRRAGTALHPSPDISWIDDRLPALADVRRRDEKYGLILLVAVWQHLRPEQHAQAISTLAALAAPDGRLILSLRHGPGSPARPCFPARPERIVAAAERAGLSLVRRRTAPSVQQKNREAGVTWTWLCFDRR
jgi:SAM-dependent methyltransferase